MSKALNIIPHNVWLSKDKDNGETTICGLVGTAGNLFKPDVDAFNHMLYCDFLRGPHATGVAAVRGAKVDVLKRAWDPLSLMSHKSYDNLVTMQADVLIGHNRHGTRGNNENHQNAHPFNFSRLVGAHNGTLHHGTISNLKDNYKYETDSEALYCDMDANGIDETFTKIDGAWALSFYDRKDKTINLIRNDQRPLYFGYRKGRGALYWASELQMLYWILGRNKIELEGDTCYELPVDTLFTWTVGNKMEAPTTRPLKATYESPWKKGQVWRDGKWQEPLATTGCYINGKWVAKTEGKDEPPFEKQTSVIHLPSRTETTSNASTVSGHGKDTKKSNRMLPYRDGDNNMIHRLHFSEIMREKTCVWCNKDENDWGDNVKFLKCTHGEKHPDFLCEECASDPDIVDMCVSSSSEGK